METLPAEQTDSLEVSEENDIVAGVVCGFSKCVRAIFDILEC